MAIQKRTLKRTGADGTKYERVVWRARVPDPTKPPGASAKIERTFALKKDAERWETAQRHAAASGTYIDRHQGQKPLREVADAWRETWDAKPLSPKTQQGYASVLANHVLPRWGDVRVAAIDAKSIQKWVNDLSAERHAETVHHAYTVLRQTLKIAVAHKLIVANPCTPEAITLPSKMAARSTQPGQLALTAPELRKLADAMPEHWRTPTLVAGWCGLRAGELWALRRADYDPLHGTLTVRYALKDIGGRLIAGPTKTSQTRSLTVPEPLQPMLLAAATAPGPKPRPIRPSKRGQPRPARRYPAITDGQLTTTTNAADPDRLLFTTPQGTPVQHTNFYERTFRPVVVKLWPPPHRLSTLRWHDLRHTAASLAVAATGNLAIVQKRLGHSSITTTFDRYHHLLPDADRNLADALGAMFDAPADNTERNVVELPIAEKKSAR